MRKTVVVVDDEVKIRGLVRSYLEREGYTVREAGTGAAAVQLAPVADLVVLDLRLPDCDGEDVARRIRSSAAVPIIMLTAKASESQRIAGLRLGADDYVTKPFSPRELVARVDAVLRRSTGARGRDGAVSFGGGLLRLDTERREVRVQETVVPLTRTEFDVLATLAGRPGRVWSRDELLRRVHGDGSDALERTADVHVKNLRRKLADPRLVTTVAGVGYRLGVDRDG